MTSSDHAALQIFNILGTTLERCTDRRPRDKRPPDKRPLKMPTLERDHSGKRPSGQETTIVEILKFTLKKFIMNFVRPKKVQNVLVILASEQTDMFEAEYIDYDDSSGAHCRVIKIQHQTERLCLSRHLVRYSRQL